MSKLISILGAGESGVGAAILAKAKGYNVFVSDKGEIADKYKKELLQANIEFEEGNHSFDVILSSIEVIKSPGIPDKIEIIKQLRKKGIAVISEIEFAARYTNAKLIGITGSNGKTTTTLLTYHLLKNLGLNVGLAGNIGVSFAKQVAYENYDYYVLEVSSFQLDGILRFRPYISMILNITPDHLDRYEYYFQNYVDAKFKITSNLTPEDHFIYWNGDATVLDELQKRNLSCNLHPVSLENNSSSVYSDGEFIHINYKSKNTSVAINELPISGKHNQINMMCAIMVARLLELDATLFQNVLNSFKNISHRLELVRNYEGVQYINDSKATNVDSVYYALDSMKTPVILIAGGVDKGNDYTHIEALIVEKVKAIVCMGVDNSKLFHAFEGKVKLVSTHSLYEAIEESQKLAIAGDTVLLSPACASFDLFKNYEDRGNQFMNIVNSL
ncbi:MAG: UDP-N-acetylmuramoyl-L-alanine--D-glutamate ligase [Cytophagales bacterium]|nr:MAG: UDP-N-acetylmuramoyl-L-alanine--D-glutamate ligase [Cytophagales bacterium]